MAETVPQQADLKAPWAWAPYDNIGAWLELDLGKTMEVCL